MMLLLALRQLFTAGFFEDRGIPEPNEWLRCLAVSWSFRLAVLPVLQQLHWRMRHAFPHIPLRRVPQQWTGRVRRTTAMAALTMTANYLDPRSLQEFSAAATGTRQALRMALATQGLARCLTRGR